MLAVSATYYRGVNVRVGEIFDVDTEGHADKLEEIGHAKRVDTASEPMTVAEVMVALETSPIVKRRRGRPPKNKVMIPSTGGEYQTK